MSGLAAFLRLARFGLAPTAVADCCVLYFLTHADPWSGSLHATMRSEGEGVSVAPLLPAVDWTELLRLAVVSAGLYAFGMIQNDLVDRSRDALVKRDRPLVSGELTPDQAAVAMYLCAGAAFAAAFSLGEWSLVATGAAFALINLYHLATKTAGGAGVLNLGLVRFANAMVPLADSHFTLPAFLVCAHVTLLTAVAYQLEGKQPRLGLRDFLLIGGGLALVGVGAAAGLAGPDWQWSNAGLKAAASVAVPEFTEATGLVGLGAFAIFAVHAGRQLSPELPDPAPARGGLLIKNGLLYLFVIDAAVLVAGGRWMGAVYVVALLAGSRMMMTMLRKPPGEPPRTQ